MDKQAAENSAPNLTPEDNGSGAPKAGKEKINIKDLIRPTLVLLIICGLCASLIAAVYVITADRIAENTREEQKQAIMSIFPAYASHTLAESESPTCDFIATVSDENGNVLGYAVSVLPMGFKAEINMIVGVSTDNKVIDIVVTSISDTAGIGSKVKEEDNIAQYKGADSSVAFGNGVEAITGATISSKAFLRGVKEALSICEEL